MPVLKTPNGYLRAAPSDGAADAAYVIPDNTVTIEVYARTIDQIVGLSTSATAILDTSPDTKGSIAVAGNTDPLVLSVDPTASGGDRFTHLHYKPAATGSASAIIVNCFR